MASALLIVAPLIGWSPAAAQSRESDAAVSSDGTTFSDGVVGIFDTETLVPGDMASASVWIKNTAATPAAVRVSVRDLVTTSVDYAENLWLSVGGTGSSANEPRQLAGLDDCDVLVHAESVPIDGVIRVDLRLSLADVDGMIAQGQSSTLDLVVGMRDSAAGPFPESACDDDGPVVSTGSGPSDRYDAIAATGASDPDRLILTGGLAVAAGALLIGARRRKGGTDDAATRDSTSSP